ncbi:hypothetical protein SB767_34420, partial [Bacillus sp. SIMBA_069]
MEEGASASSQRPVGQPVTDAHPGKPSVDLNVDNNFASLLPESEPVAPVSETLSTDGKLVTLTGTKDNLVKV